MSSSFLSVDLGNTRCKLCLWTIVGGAGAELVAAGELETQPGIAARAVAWIDALARPESAAVSSIVPRAIETAAVSSVSSRAVEDELCAALESRVGRVERHPSPGLANLCREPQSVGSDRLFAARGAYELVRGSAIVVDAGTALTVDALRAAGKRVEFLGGAIAPGPKLLAESLARGTARLMQIEPRPRVAALGRDTESALQSGVVIGFRGAARELVEQVSAEAQLDSAPIVLAGGARIFLTEPACFGARRVLEAQELVHRGLIAACFAAPPGS